MLKGLWAPVILPRPNSFSGGNYRDSERIETAVLLKNLHEWQQLHSQPMAVWIILNSKITFLEGTYLKWQGIDPWHAKVKDIQRDRVIHQAQIGGWNVRSLRRSLYQRYFFYQRGSQLFFNCCQLLSSSSKIDLISDTSLASLEVKVNR